LRGRRGWGIYKIAVSFQLLAISPTPFSPWLFSGGRPSVAHPTIILKKARQESGRPMADEYSEDMNLIANGIYKFLEPLGFTKREYTFNKWTKEGLCHVFNLQMGIKSLEGQFTANLGIFVPEIFQDTRDKEIPRFIPEPMCAFRARFSEFAEIDDKWWEITPYPESTINELIDLLQIYGLPFFIKFADRQSIIRQMVSFNDKYCVSLHPKLDIALILDYSGKHEEAEIMFNQHFKKSVTNQGYIEHLEQIAIKHNWRIVSE
jgi:hypothetical protein